MRRFRAVTLSVSLLSLVFVRPAGAATRTWDGSTSASWATASNWMENAVPIAGDDLVFPAGAMNLAMSNNIAAGTAFNSLTFQAGGYSISTNQFALNAGITDNDTAGTNTINVNVAILMPQSWVTASGGTLNVPGTLGMNAGVTFTIGGGGTTNLSGIVGGATGSLVKTGAGTLTLSNANTYGGTTSIDQGTLTISNGAALGGTGAGTTLASGAVLQIMGGITCAEPLVVNGYGLSALTGAVRTVSGVNTWTGTINFATSGSFGVDNGAQLTVNGVVSGGGAANVAKYGTGLLVFAGANTYTGGTGVETGTLRAQNSASLGGAAGIGTVVNTGTLELQGGVVLAENLSFNSNPIATGNLRNLSGVNVITGAADFNSPTVIGVDAGSLSLTSFLAGTSGFTKVGPEILILSGANAYTGDTLVSAGTLQIRNGASLGSTAAGTTVASGAALEIQGSMAVGTESLTIEGTGVAANGALRNVSGTSSWAGPITMTAATTANIAAGQLTLSGAVSGTGALTKAGPGTLVLSTANTYSGGTFVTSGTLVVNGSLPNADTVTVSAGATLGGSGSVGPIANNGGTVSPGQSAPGLLSSGPVTFGSMSTFKVEIGGANPGAGYDQLAVTGTVQLGNVTLSPSMFGAFAPPPGSTYTIISNDGADPVTGTFLGLAEGSFLTLSGYRFQISYVGGDGNDVVLTRVATTRTWTGATSMAWTVGGNWMGGVAPVVGDDLVFPAGAMNLTNANDFPMGFAVNSITISASGYTLNTAQMVLYNGITATYTNGVSTVNTSGSLAQAQTFTSAATGPGAYLTLTGTFTWNGFDLTIGGVGNTQTGNLATLSGTGNLVKTGSGVLFLLFDDSYSGTTTVSGGALAAYSDFALGTTGAGTTVQSGASLWVANTHTYAEPLTLNGSGLSGTGALRSTANNNTWTGPINAPTAVSIGVDGNQLDIQGVVSGPGNLSKVGGGLLVLSGTNTFTGFFNISQGIVQPASSAAFGSLALGTGVNSGAVLQLVGGVSIPEGIGVMGTGILSNGAIRSVSGANTLTGQIQLTGDTTFGVDSGSLTLGNMLYGSFSVAKVGAGRLDLAAANTYTGTTTINAGSVRVLHASALGDPAAATSVASGAALEIAGDITVASEPLVLNGTGGGNGALRSISGNNTWNGPVALATTSSVSVSPATNLTLNGVMSASGGLTKIGGGTLVLTNANTYSGATTVSAGTLLVNGSQSQSPVGVSAAAILGGAGTAGAVTSTGGTVSPGNSPGILQTGSVSLDAASTYSIELNGTSPGSGYDRLTVTGSVNLGGATLAVAVGYTPSPGDTYVIVDNDAADAVTGTFAGLANGAMFTVGSYQLQISYTGGDGNDVVLTFVGCVSDVTGPTVTAPASATVTQTICQ